MRCVYDNKLPVYRRQPKLTESSSGAPGPGLKMVTDREGERRGEQPIPAIDTRIRGLGNGTEFAADKLAGDRPIPMLAFVADPEAADVQIGIGDQRGVIALRGGGLTEKVAGAHIITFAQLAGDPQFVKEAGVPIERQGSEAIDDGAVDAIPVAPVDVEFYVPIGGWAEGDAAGDDLGKFEVGSGVGSRRQQRVVWAERGHATVIERSAAGVFGAEGPLGQGLPKQAGRQPIIQIAPLKVELEWGNQDALAQFHFGIIEGRANRQRQGRVRFPGDDRANRDILEFDLETGITKGRVIRPFHAQAEWGVDSHAERDRRVLKREGVLQFRNRDDARQVMRRFTGGRFVVAINIQVEEGADMNLLPLELADAGRIVIEGSG